VTNSQTSPKKDTTVRVPWDLLEQIRVIAQAHERSLVAEVRYALAEYVRREQRRPEE